MLARSGCQNRLRSIGWGGPIDVGETHADVAFLIVSIFCIECAFRSNGSADLHTLWLKRRGLVELNVETSSLIPNAVFLCQLITVE